MSINTRRSARIAEALASASSIASTLDTRMSASPSIQIVPVVKQQEDDESTTAPKKSKSKPTPKQVIKASTSKCLKVEDAVHDESMQSQKDAFHNLPPEVLDMIIDNVSDPVTLNAICQTSRFFYPLAMRRLYRHIAVSAMFHAKMPKLIRTLEPLMTVRQKKELKKIGKYRGQSETYPRGINEDEVPICASYVTHLTAGLCDPGRAHKEITKRYVAEALKNMSNLQVVDAGSVVSDDPSMIESIVSLSFLRALRIEDVREDLFQKLKGLKNLTHLSVVLNGYKAMSNLEVLSSMLQLSQSTMTGIEIAGAWILDLEHLLKPLGTQSLQMPKLKSLNISALAFDMSTIPKFIKMFPIPNLHDFTTGPLHGDYNLYFDSLAFTFKAVPSTKHKLRELTMFMGSQNEQWVTPNEPNKLDICSKSKFISSFDTLTYLKLNDYGMFANSVNREQQKLDSNLLRAILCHHNLKTLRFYYGGLVSGFNIPRLTNQEVKAIIEGLPCLETFGAAFYEDGIDDLAAILCTARNLTTLSVETIQGWRSDHESFNSSFLKVLLGHFLRNINATINPKLILWEDHYRLRSIRNSYQNFEISGSKSKHKGKGRGKLMEFHDLDESGNEGKRKVFVRDNIAASRMMFHVGYDPYFRWMNKVDGIRSEDF